MIGIDAFIKIRERFGHFASWAVWAESGKNPKDNIGDLTILDPVENPELLDVLHSDLILLGLNISRKIERPLGNFHDSRSVATDFKIRYALKDTVCWGAYMTDIIKDFEEKAAGQTMNFLRKNKQFERENIKRLREEITILGSTNPIIITFGKDAELIARRNFDQEFQIIRIPHYASYVSKENYRVQVCEELQVLTATDTAYY